MRQLKITKNITNRETKSLELYFSEISKIKQLTVEEEGEMAAIASASNKNQIAREAAIDCLLYTSPSPRDLSTSRMPSSA